MGATVCAKLVVRGKPEIALATGARVRNDQLPALLGNIFAAEASLIRVDDMFLCDPPVSKDAVT